MGKVRSECVRTLSDYVVAVVQSWLFDVSLLEICSLSDILAESDIILWQ